MWICGRQAGWLVAEHVRINCNIVAVTSILRLSVARRTEYVLLFELVSKCKKNYEIMYYFLFILFCHHFCLYVHFMCFIFSETFPSWNDNCCSCCSHVFLSYSLVGPYTCHDGRWMMEYGGTYYTYWLSYHFVWQHFSYIFSERKWTRHILILFTHPFALSIYIFIFICLFIC